MRGFLLFSKLGEGWGEGEEGAHTVGVPQQRLRAEVLILARTLVT